MSEHLTRQLTAPEYALRLRNLSRKAWRGSTMSVLHYAAMELERLHCEVEYLRGTNQGWPSELEMRQRLATPYAERDALKPR